MTSLGLVVSRELREALRRRSFWIVCAVLLAGSTAAMVLPSVLSGGPEVDHVSIVEGMPPSLRDRLAHVGANRVEITVATDLDAARDEIEHDRADVAVAAGDPPTVIVKSGEHETLVGEVQQVLAEQQLTDHLGAVGLSGSQVAGALAVTPPHVDSLDAGSGGRRAAAAILATVLYLLLLTLMLSVANGVAIEKANRISEVLLAIVRPGPLLFGKVIGVGLVGLVSMLCGALPLLVKLSLGGDLPNGFAGAVLGSAAWFALGLALYLVTAGALGALVERQEEAGSTLAPLMFVLIGSYLVAQSAPESSLATVLAYVPFSSPVVEPARLAIGASSPFEVLGSLVLGLVAIVLALRIGSTIYRHAIVRTGRRLRIHEALRVA
jgi:ABC-2 type transport system permease protein